MTPTERPLDGLRVMVVDDDTLIASLLEEVLSAMGVVVCGTALAETDAISLALQTLPDVMIVDAQLGKGSGILAVVEIWKTRPVPHIFVSGNAARVLRQCPDAVILQKPFSEEELRSALQQVAPLLPPA
jgi:CheY-like chemotaxis protein